MDQLVAALIGSALLVFGAVRLFTIDAQTRAAVGRAQRTQERMSERSPLAQFWLDETRTRKTLLWTGIGCVIGGVVLLVAAIIG